MAKESVLHKVATGCFSLTFLWCFKKKEYIVKCPLHRGHFAYKRWFSHIQTEKIFLEEYAPHQCKIVLPKILDVADFYIVQKKIDGIPLTEEVYSQLASSEQQQIACWLAFFFFKLHQKTIRDIPIKKTSKICFSKFQKFFDKDTKKIYEKYKNLLKEKTASRNFPCLCIADLKSSHILYDLKKKKLGLVDFGSVHFDFPENEFILENPIRSHLSLKMMKDIVSAYNTYQKKDVISWERVKSFLVLNALKETYNMSLKIPQEKEYIGKGLYSFIQKIEQL